MHIEKNLSKMLKDDNIKLIQKMAQQNTYFLQFQSDFPSKIVEEVKVRTLFTMQVPQKKDYFGLPGETPTEEEAEVLKSNLEKMRKKVTNFGKSISQLPNMQVTFYTRAKAMEICFGDPNNEEPNIAASILRSVLKLNANVRMLVVQNIVLSGGSSMIPGFKLRVKQEMEYLINNYKEFEELATLKPHIKFAESYFPPNCMAWVGASIMSGLN